jgi:hypothetical protein
MTKTATPVRYGNLSRSAREMIKFWFGGPVTIAGYVRYWFDDGVWHGDSCGCPDDRCIGFHHEGPDDCHCLEVTLGEYATWTQGCPVCGELVEPRWSGRMVYDKNRLVITYIHEGCAD